MRRTLFGAGAALACLGVAATGLMVEACGYGGPSPLARFALADCVVVGRVVFFEDQDVAALSHPLATRLDDYKIAVVQVINPLKGAEKGHKLRLGLRSPQNLHTGQEACFFLNRHFEEDFLQMERLYDFPIGKAENPDFDGQIGQFQKLAKLWRNPVASLQSKDADERLQIVALLVSHYRTPRVGALDGAVKTQPIDARQSKLILEALAKADWTKDRADFRLTPAQLFAQLGATAQHGWDPPNFRTPRNGRPPPSAGSATTRRRFASKRSHADWR